MWQGSAALMPCLANVTIRQPADVYFNELIHTHRRLFPDPSIMAS